MGVGAGSLKILTGVLVHRVTRPLRGSVSCGSGWSVPCVSIQLTLSFTVPCVSIQLTLSQVSSRPLRGSVSCGSGWSVPCVSIQLTLLKFRPSAPSRGTWQRHHRPVRSGKWIWPARRIRPPLPTSPPIATRSAGKSTSKRAPTYLRRG